MTAGELARLTGLTTGAVTGLIDRFEKRKLVKRQLAEGDRRKVIVVPHIDRIMALLEPFYKEFRRRSEDLIASFSEKELKAVEAYLTGNIELMNTTLSEIRKK